MDVIGGKYKAQIAYGLLDGTMRYSEIQRALPRAAPRMLSKPLKGLEEGGIVLCVRYPVVPPGTEYSLTEFGQTPVPIVRALCAWGEHYSELAGLPVPGNLVLNMYCLRTVAHARPCHGRTEKTPTWLPEGPPAAEKEMQYKNMS